MSAKRPVLTTQHEPRKEIFQNFGLSCYVMYGEAQYEEGQMVVASKEILTSSHTGVAGMTTKEILPLAG